MGAVESSVDLSHCEVLPVTKYVDTEPKSASDTALGGPTYVAEHRTAAEEGCTLGPKVAKNRGINNEVSRAKILLG